MFERTDYVRVTLPYFGAPIRHFAREQKLGKEAEQHAYAVRIYAEARMGELLKEQTKQAARRMRGGDQKSMSLGNDIDSIPTLTDLGLSRNESSRYQKLAAAHLDN